MPRVKNPNPRKVVRIAGSDESDENKITPSPITSDDSLLRNEFPVTPNEDNSSSENYEVNTARGSVPSENRLPEVPSLARRRPKSKSARILNQRVMIWMKNRFKFGGSGTFSASEISELYKADTEHMEDPPPGLINYQVGQMVRRVFPNIQRRKITIKKKRHWVYKGLSLIENPVHDLFNIETERLHEESTTESVASVSPQMRYYDDKTQEPSDATFNLQAKTAGIFFTKTSRKNDHDVINWLKEHYKYKPNFYVRSVDLLRKYNAGRKEEVKYLSQVGRVMKHVFPEVKHMRKSIKIGGRKWIYLHLKPRDVESDSEEGQSMVMPTKRKSVSNLNAIDASHSQNGFQSYESQLQYMAPQARFNGQFLGANGGINDEAWKYAANWDAFMRNYIASRAACSFPPGNFYVNPNAYAFRHDLASDKPPNNPGEVFPPGCDVFRRDAPVGNQRQDYDVFMRNTAAGLTDHEERSSSVHANVFKRNAPADDVQPGVLDLRVKRPRMDETRTAPY